MSWPDLCQIWRCQPCWLQNTTALAMSDKGEHKKVLARRNEMPNEVLSWLTTKTEPNRAHLSHESERPATKLVSITGKPN